MIGSPVSKSEAIEFLSTPATDTVFIRRCGEATAWVACGRGPSLQFNLYHNAAEYRYDGGRERYLVRPRDPVTLDVLPGALWRDYDDENIYGDFGIDPATGDVTQGTAYLAGVGLDEPSASDMPGYFGWDQIGTTRAISGTNAGGPPVLRETTYTAFGEVFSSAGSCDTRYGYAGTWGYETAESFDPLEELGWLHVGHRYYDPASGRFVQRDPIGIRGGSNVYEYARSKPTQFVDPEGEVVVAAIGGTIIAGGIDAPHSLCVIHDATKLERAGVRRLIEHTYDSWRNSLDYDRNKKVHEIKTRSGRVKYRVTITPGPDGKQSYVVIEPSTGLTDQWYRD